MIVDCDDSMNQSVPTFVPGPKSREIDVLFLLL